MHKASRAIERAPQTRERQTAAEGMTQSIRLVVVEDGAGPLEGQIPPEGCDDTVILGQFRGEPPGEFGRRVVRRIVALERQGRPIVLALVLLAPRFDPALTEARLLIVRALMAHSTAHDCCCRALLLRPRNELRDHDYKALLKLIDALLEEPGSWSLPVRVRFAGAASGAQSDQRAASGTAGVAWRSLLGAERPVHCGGGR